MFENINISWIGVWQAFTGYMTDLSQNPFKTVTLILDLVIVGYLIYKFVIYAKKTRTWQLLKGIGWIIAIVVISEILQLRILNLFLTFFMPYGVIALIVIFQPELRRMLEQIGTNRITKYFGFDKDLATKTKEDIYKIVIAATELAKTKTGGLIVLERDIQINDIADTGVRIGSEVSPQLLVNLFVPNTPLHDGAVIIANNKIVAAACILPLANDKDIAKELGTRHRAGLGISKESDAIAVIISEETGKISVAKEGTLIVDVKEDSLKNILIKHIVIKRFGDEKLKRVEKIRTRKQQSIDQNKKER
ncbi:MAG: TIGR00159 family protein [Clostridia bacterium]|jgi:diadenylate cyclase|nr:TIGR00159 family protein [Clostridia bacterium]MCI9413412.1 TIGR00159 family protein [Clostridia bacterium]